MSFDEEWVIVISWSADAKDLGLTSVCVCIVILFEVK